MERATAVTAEKALAVGLIFAVTDDILALAEAAQQDLDDYEQRLEVIS